MTSANVITPDMPAKLLDYLRRGGPALLLTTGADGYPSSAYTWAVALDGKRLRFGADEGGSGYGNLQRTSQAAVHIIGPDNLAYLVKGTTRFLKEHINAASPARMALFELDVIGARDQSFPGVTAKPFTYEWPAAQRDALTKMEQSVFTEMRDFAK
ncbi:pyridoxamine 5'-phosphate oxidase family protein [Aromatoleum anaerobium]|uniref:Pyridoxamine 5'-phosphate oxidase N-terminal domain-containing protein n=1 Tax=Aromatoleum anaerobium TaxID=182180 RepID=A0ABX1PNH2_9RHOO|nr:pyridoxamine 5'-phosphate oxidase family protein [Aromatoleum anaerobium]MCK0506108.1 pyridoxamine 5'-phosphate oxidase family protein [Aromatoleum anaerobium]